MNCSLAIFGVGLDEPELSAALVAAAVAVATVLLRGIGLVVSGQQARQRELFSKAYKAAMSWREMLYRVRRRVNSADAEYELIERFHELQELMNYYEGWTATEGRAIGRSYCQLVNGVKKTIEEPLQEAWAEPGRTPGAPAPAGEVHPDLTKASDRFLFDVRCQLALWLLPRLLVRWRNRQWLNDKGGGR